MKKAILATLLAISTTAAASEIKYDYLEVSKQKVKAGDINFRGTGFGGSMLTDGGLLLVASKRDLDTDINVRGFNVNMGVEVTSFGFGGKSELSDYSDFFFLIQYVDMKAKVSMLGYSDSITESGKGAQMGVRSMASDNLELSASINYIDVEGSSSTKNLGANYYLTDSFSLGVNYELDGSESGTSIVARMYF